MSHRFHILDVFSDKKYKGNQLAVVEDCDDLSQAQMQEITVEFGFSETVFLQKSENPVAAARLRIFTPDSEIPFAGHPTIGCAVLLAELKNQQNVPSSDLLMMLEEKIGLVRTAISFEGAATYAEFDAPELPRLAAFEPKQDLMADALGVSVADIGFENHKACAVHIGPLFVFVFVPVRNSGILKVTAPTYPYWHEAYSGLETFGVYAYCREDGARGGFQARMFGPDLGVPEDPATGSAAAAFSQVIQQFEIQNRASYETHISQGREMGRASSIKLEVEFDGPDLRLVRVGGFAVRVAEGELL